ncbi:hypothetical protein HPB51_014413 [Rhipicephalus microplus]|uniref:Uncharacterized protein n=1 Tax=Rhipicephalus microplus TaxID=6941 RepID=A0A9J6F3W3_RHIMP|nr:hypothetical protein HPB51_014413 [Rhipicephalus microplus]
MVWTSVPSSDSRQELPESFKSTTLAATVARRAQASNALTADSADAASLAAAANADASVCSPTFSLPVTRSVGSQRGHRKPLWRPQHLPKPKATEFVVVLKPRTQLSLADAFPDNGARRALIAHLGTTATRLITVEMLREQNLILVYTSNPHIADKLIGEFAAPSPAGLVPLFGFLRTDTQDSCYGVVKVRISYVEDALRETLYCPEGGILHVRRLGTSNKVCLTFSGKPAVSVAPLDIDPTPVSAPNQTFGASAEKRYRSRMAPVLLMSVRPGALLVLGPPSPGTSAVKNATGRRPFKPPPPSSVGQAGRKKRRRRRRWKSGSRSSPQVAQPTAINPVLPPLLGTVALGAPRRVITTDGPPASRPTVGQPLSAPPKPKPSLHELKPAAQGDPSWADTRLTRISGKLRRAGPIYRVFSGVAEHGSDQPPHSEQLSQRRPWCDGNSGTLPNPEDVATRQTISTTVACLVDIEWCSK